MKRRLYLIILLAAVAFSGMAQNIGEAFYIYRNDGQFNAFFRDEVQSIEYSYEDAEGNSYDEIVTQIVTTADSIYKIPIASIDSIGFVQPETIYNSQVVRMEPLLPYIVSVDVLTVTFSSSIPSNLMPNVGDVLLHDSFESELMPEGFAGRVVQRSGQQVICESVSFEDIYEQIVCYGTYTAVNDETSNCMRLVPRKVNGGSISTAINIGGTLSPSESLNISVNGSLGLELRATFKFSIGKSPYIDVSLAPDLRLTFEVEASSEGNTDNLLSKKVSLLSLPIPNTPFLLKLKAGPALEASLTASVTITTEAALGYKFGVKYEEGEFKGYGQNTSKWFSMPEINGSLSGSIFAGIQTEFGIFSYGDLLSLSIEKEAGIEFEANLTKDLLTSESYEELQNAQFDLNLVASVGVSAKAQFFKWLSASADWTLLSGQLNINSWKLVPSFQKPEVQSHPTSALISVNPSEKLLFPVSIGIGVWDNSGNLQDAQYCVDAYRVLEDWPHYQYQARFSNLLSNQDYNAYPLVKLFGMQIKATPTEKFQTKTIPVRITRFNQTDYKYSYHCFPNHAKYYSYKWECEVTVSLDDTTNVADWGYVYEDPYGGGTLISLKSFSSPHTETRYSYFSNEPSSTVRLYEFVKYSGDDKWYFGEPKDYQVTIQAVNTCPDANHPHMIDLGLPSGTKWACCNVGASTPEGFGSHYAWGETSPKSIYFEGNYTGPMSPEGIYEENDFDIAGTQYDAATANWGSPWRMPSPDQFVELINNCTSVWTTHNAIYGRKFTGPNGETIFFPAAGYRWGEALICPDIDGEYWSSFFWNHADNPIELSFSHGEGHLWTGAHNYAGGLNVRPVCTK